MCMKVFRQGQSDKVIKCRTSIKQDDKLGSMEYSSQRNASVFQLGIKTKAADGPSKIIQIKDRC